MSDTKGFPMTSKTRLSSSAFAVALVLAAPAGAQAAEISFTEVDRTNNVLKITDRSENGTGHAQDITIAQVQEGGQLKLRLTRDGGLGMIPTAASQCTGIDEVVTCTMPTSVQVDGGGKGDVFAAENDLPIPVDMDGGAGRDELRGGAANDELNGGSGDDLLDGNDGNDEMTGGPNADHFNGGRGDADVVVYEADRAEGVDVTIGDGLANDGSAADLSFVAGSTDRDEVTGSVEEVNGTDEDDNLRGSLASPKAETLRGKGGDDELRGNAGNDVLDAGPGADRLAGNDGDDRLKGGLGRDEHAGGNGIDTADYSDHTFAVVVTIGSPTVQGESANADQDGNIFEDTGLGNENVDSGTEHVIGTNVATGDKITGTAANEQLSGLAGNDVLDGGLGADDYLGGAGNDTIRARDGVTDAAIDCGPGIDTLIADAADPVAIGCENVDRPIVAQPGGSAAVRDTVFDLSLSAKGRQRLARKKALVLALRCPTEACLVKVQATLRIGKRKLTLKGTSRSLGAGQTATVKVKMTKRQLKTLRKGQRQNRRVRAQIVADGFDAAGNTSRLTRPVKGIR
jgi:Ca2+-binding RTX toxin-like protein